MLMIIPPILFGYEPGGSALSLKLQKQTLSFPRFSFDCPAFWESLLWEKFSLKLSTNVSAWFHKTKLRLIRKPLMYDMLSHHWYETTPADLFAAEICFPVSLQYLSLPWIWDDAGRPVPALEFLFPSRTYDILSYPGYETTLADLYADIIFSLTSQVLSCSQIITRHFQPKAQILISFPIQVPSTTGYPAKDTYDLRQTDISESFIAGRDQVWNERLAKRILDISEGGVRCAKCRLTITFALQSLLMTSEFQKF